MTFLTDAALKMFVVLGVALLATVALRKRSAAVRHWILSAAVLCAGLMPVGTWLLPAWKISPAASEVLSASTLTRTFSAASASHVVATVPGPSVTLPWLAIVWLAGAGISFLALAVGFARLLTAAKYSEWVTDGEWFRIAEEVSQQYGLKRCVCLLRSQSFAMLVTWGSLRPRILLPAGSELWSEERIRVVLQHEMAHVRRNDWLLHTVAELLRAVYWFNPLLWLACRRLRLESEYAADDAVLAQGVSSSRYATHLLEIVRAVQQPDRSWSSASAMARPSTIERRFTAMLNSTTDRRPLGRLATVAVAIVLLCMSLSLAALSASEPIPIAVPTLVIAPPPIPESPKPVAQQVLPSPGTTPARGQQPQAPITAAPKTQYTGELISLDLKNVDIKDFMRIIADVGGLSLVLDQDVTGNITIQLKELPWDQALDIVANNKQLGIELNGRVLHVASKGKPVAQGRIALDFEVFKNGKLLGKPRITTVGNTEATISQGDFTITVTPTEVAGNKVELSLTASVSGQKIAVRVPVSKDVPGKVLWESSTDSMEIRVTLASGQ